MIETTQEAIEKRIWRKICFVFGVLVFLTSTIMGMGFWQVYHKVKDFTAETISKKFAEPSIEATFLSVAENQARQILTGQVQPTVSEMKQTLQEETLKFMLELDNLRSKFEGEFEKLNREVQVLDDRNQLVSFADIAIADGDRSKFDELEAISEDGTNPLSKAATAEILRIKTHYATMTRIKHAQLSHKGIYGAEYKDDEIKTPILIGVLKENPRWILRAKAAQLLRSRKEKGVPEALLYAIKNDPRLDVLKIAVESFERVTGFKSSDVFGHSVDEWWGLNNEKVQETLKELNGG